MKIYCEFNTDYEPLLQDIVNYAIENYGNHLNISTLIEIELADKELFPYETEGKLASKEKIFLNSGRFELLPCLDIKTLYDNTDFKSIVNTLVHEMGHLNDWLAMPNLYECVFDCQNKKHYSIALFWLEYIAESRTANLGLYDYTSYCKDVASELWDIQMCSLKPEELNRHNYYWLNKHLSYFIPRAYSDLHKYLSMIKVPHLKDYILELVDELERLKALGTFDDVTLLYDLYENHVMGTLKGAKERIDSHGK